MLINDPQLKALHTQLKEREGAVDASKGIEMLERIAAEFAVKNFPDCLDALASIKLPEDLSGKDAQVFRAEFARAIEIKFGELYASCRKNAGMGFKVIITKETVVYRVREAMESASYFSQNYR